MFKLISPYDLSQLGDGSPPSGHSLVRFIPVGVLGLSSNVSLISLGTVRLTFCMLVVRTWFRQAVVGFDVGFVLTSDEIEFGSQRTLKDNRCAATRERRRLTFCNAEPYLCSSCWRGCAMLGI
jgi:hypothetical protein